MKKEKKNSGLIGLRGILVLMTALGFHYSMLYGMVPAKSQVGVRMFNLFYVFGLTAPNVFLIMSGYFMYHKYRQRIRDGLGFKDYLAPRVKKIYPLMIFFHLYLFAVENIGKLQLGVYPLHADGGELRYSLKSLIVSILGIQSGLFAEADSMSVNGPSWFVTTLMLCYILYFLIVRFVKNKQLECAVYVMLGIIGVIFTFRPVHFPFLYECSARGLFFFFAGIIIHIAMDASSENGRKKQICVAILLLIVMGILTVLVNYNDFTVWQTYLTWPCMVYLIINSNTLQKALSFPPFVWVGNRSMSVFLGNLPILTTVSWLNLLYGWNLDYGNWTVWLLVAALTLIIGEITYYIFENRRRKK
ncbi:MAG: acyltransferase [Ruminococcus sp.]|nr:acyltransferase [Ruminococcus sp.]